MKTLYIMCGVAFSGKTTLSKKIAEHKNAVRISQDELWFEKEKEWGLEEDGDEGWEKVIKLSKQRIREALTKGSSVVFDDISLKYSHREDLRKMASEFGAQAVVVYLDTPLEIQRKRQENNLISKDHHHVKQELIDWAVKELEIPQTEENIFVFKPNTNLEDWLNKLP